jgi:hypothetical protein
LPWRSTTPPQRFARWRSENGAEAKTEASPVKTVSRPRQAQFHRTTVPSRGRLALISGIGAGPRAAERKITEADLLFRQMSTAFCGATALDEKWPIGIDRDKSGEYRRPISGKIVQCTTRGSNGRFGVITILGR